MHSNKGTKATRCKLFTFEHSWVLHYIHSNKLQLNLQQRY